MPLRPAASHRLEQVDGGRGSRVSSVLAPEAGRLAVDGLQLAGVRRRACVRRPSRERVVDRGDLLDAAHGRARSRKPSPGGEAPLQPRFDLLGEASSRRRCRPPRPSRCSGSARSCGQHAGDRRLLDRPGAVIAPVEAVEQRRRWRAPRARSRRGRAGAALARAEPQQRVVEAGRDQVVLERPLVLEVELGLAALDLVERRLGDDRGGRARSATASGGRRRSAAACGYGRRRRRRRS
jgi:hypothetical protein